MEENDSNMSVFDERDNGEIKSVNIFAVTFHPSAMLGILKIIHDRRQAQQSFFPGFAVAHSAVKCIHVRLSSGTGCALFCDYYSRNHLHHARCR